MRLLHAQTLEFEEYHNNIPPYAILSHMWGDDEVLFADWNQPDKTTAKTKKGYRKIKLTCLQAARDNLSYAWVDTICIDKSSSSELSEAINSMFAWYRDAEVCYAYLEDVCIQGGTPQLEEGAGGFREHFAKSKWFTRGWTLQELLAPSQVVFYSSEWLEISTKNNYGMTYLLRDITGISTDCLLNVKDVLGSSVARRMSWMAKRRTTRVEDTAYCMLGLFGIHMALLYGEGHQAFLRLQEEIIRISDDQTIFCWKYPNSEGPHAQSVWEYDKGRNAKHDAHRREELQTWSSILAPNPSVFLDSTHYAPLEGYWEGLDNTITSVYSITNRGMSMRIPLLYTCKGAFLVLDVEDHQHKTTWEEGWLDDSIRLCVVLPLHRGLANAQYARLPSNIWTMRVKKDVLKVRSHIFVDFRNTGQYPYDATLSMRDMPQINTRNPTLFLTFNRPTKLERQSEKVSYAELNPFQSAVKIRDMPAFDGLDHFIGYTSIMLETEGRFDKIQIFIVATSHVLKNQQNHSSVVTMDSRATVSSEERNKAEVEWHVDAREVDVRKVDVREVDVREVELKNRLYPHVRSDSFPDVVLSPHRLKLYSRLFRDKIGQMMPGEEGNFIPCHGGTWTKSRYLQHVQFWSFTESGDSRGLRVCHIKLGDIQKDSLMELRFS